MVLAVRQRSPPGVSMVIEWLIGAIAQWPETPQLARRQPRDTVGRLRGRLGAQDDDCLMLDGRDGLAVRVDSHIDKRTFARPRVEAVEQSGVDPNR